jgi:ERF superfamily
MTDAPASLAEALALLQTKLPHIGKDSSALVGTRNGAAYGYKYADLATISKALLPVMGKLGLSFTCRPTMRDGQFVLEYELRHVTDEVGLGGAYPLPAGSPQQVGSAITYARRYCLCAVTGAAADQDDDDAQAAEQAARATANQPPEVDEHGAATVAEQTRMNRGPHPGTVRSNGTPPGDPFYVRGPVEDQPGSSLPSQRQAVVIQLAKAGIETPDAQRAEIARIIGRPVESRKDLSYTEAVRVLAEAGKAVSNA